MFSKLLQYYIVKEGEKMETLSERLKKAMQRIDINQAELVKRTNINKGALSSYLSGRYEPKQKAIYELAKALNVNEAWLMGYDVPIERTENIIESNLEELNVKIKFDDYFPLHYCTNLSAGSLEELLDNEPNAIVYVPIKYQLRKNRLHAFKVNGTSMDNVIPDGSIVIAENVDNALDLKDGTIVVAWVDNGATVKRLYAKEGSVTLMPDSSDKSHRPIDVNLDTSPIQIIGRVIWHMNPDDIEDSY